MRCHAYYFLLPFSLRMHSVVCNRNMLCIVMRILIYCDCNSFYICYFIYQRVMHIVRYIYMLLTIYSYSDVVITQAGLYLTHSHCQNPV